MNKYTISNMLYYGVYVASMLSIININRIKYLDESSYMSKGIYT